jgi:hypothetical protein
VDKDDKLIPLGDILKQAVPEPQRERFQAEVIALNPLSRVRKRLLGPRRELERELAFQHSVICQTSLPYRDPGDLVRVWKRMQGSSVRDFAVACPSLGRKGVHPMAIALVVVR